MDFAAIILTIGAALLFLAPAIFLYKKSLAEAIALTLGAESIVFSLAFLIFGFSVPYLVGSYVILMAALAAFIRPKAIKLSPDRFQVATAAFAFLLFFTWLLLTSIPFDVDAQGFGLISLAVRDGGSTRTLAPPYPEVEWAYSPFFFIFTALISRLTGSEIYIVMAVEGAMLSVLCLFLAYSLGKSLKGHKFGMVMSFMALAGTYLASAFVDSHYPPILGVVMSFLFTISFFRLLDKWSVREFIVCTISLAGIAYSHPDTIFNLGIGLLPFALILLVFRKRFGFSIGKLFIRIFSPLLASFVLFLPYALHIIFILADNSFRHTGFHPSAQNLLMLILLGGVAAPILSIIGIFQAVKGRDLAGIFMATWLISIIFFSSAGFLKDLLSFLPFSPLAFLYPFGIVWHASIIPISYLASLPVYSTIKRLKKNKPGLISSLGRLYLVLLISSAVFLLLTPFFIGGILKASKGLGIRANGEFSTPDDISAMLWIREHSPKDSIILNYPLAVDLLNLSFVGGFEGHWAPVISERRCVYARINSPMFFNSEDWTRTGLELYAAYTDPASERAYSLIKNYGIDYILVPQVLMPGQPAGTLLRWRPANPISMESGFDEAGYLEEVFSSNGAKVYKVKGDPVLEVLDALPGGPA